MSDKPFKVWAGAIFFPSLHLFNDNGTSCFGLVEHLTMQAIDAFVRINLTRWMDRLYRALVGAGLAWIAAFLIALEPVEHSQPRGDR